jgi:VIT1/CCC1 family predicted Fe2+/Mn2+ transporter
MEREVHAILGPLGVKENLSRLVAEDLLQVENDSCPATEGIDTVPDVESNGGIEKGDPNIGLTAFLLKFGEGMEEVPRSRLWKSALTIGLSYFLGGLIPLIPYMVTDDPMVGLFWSCIVTGIVLFIFGGAKTYFTGATGGYGGYLYGATSTMIVGGVAAASAFFLVKFLEASD